MASFRYFTTEDVSNYNDKDNLYIVIHGKVYDCTKFVTRHPGGEEVLLEVAGQDATEPYDEVGHSEAADRMLVRYYIGELQ
ncbi:cytochrome b5-like heme/steroid binding domain-containing protein, partial [Dactylonectria estremocensis]